MSFRTYNISEVNFQSLHINRELLNFLCLWHGLKRGLPDYLLTSEIFSTYNKQQIVLHFYKFLHTMTGRWYLFQKSMNSNWWKFSFLHCTSFKKSHKKINTLYTWLTGYRERSHQVSIIKTLLWSMEFSDCNSAFLALSLLVRSSLSASRLRHASMSICRSLLLIFSSEISASRDLIVLWALKQSTNKKHKYVTR